MFRSPPTGRALGNTVSLPVDASTRAFRRACSDPRFPFERLERDAVTLKEVSIQLRWPSCPTKGETPVPVTERTSLPPVRNSPVNDFDPHRQGFSPIQTTLQPKRPPRCKVVTGVLGSHPLEGTRGGDPELEDGAVDQGGKDDMESGFPVLKQPEVDHIHQPFSPSSNPCSDPKPRFPNLARFLGYFRSAPTTTRKSYSQVVQSKPPPPLMVYPARNRGGGREGFRSGRQGRGGGRTGGRGFVWQRTRDNNRGEEHENRNHGNGDQVEFDQQEAVTRRVGEGTGGVGANESWERAAQQKQVKNPHTLESGEINSAGGPNVVAKEVNQQPESSKTAERCGPGWREDRGETGCRHCGLRNHNSEECRRRTICEICNLSNHSTYECRRETPWNYGPELCAAQVVDQSFFFIEDIKDPKAAFEKASTDSSKEMQVQNKLKMSLRTLIAVRCGDGQQESYLTIP